MLWRWKCFKHWAPKQDPAGGPVASGQSETSEGHKDDPCQSLETTCPLQETDPASQEQEVDRQVLPTLYAAENWKKCLSSSLKVRSEEEWRIRLWWMNCAEHLIDLKTKINPLKPLCWNIFIYPHNTDKIFESHNVPHVSTVFHGRSLQMQ